MVLESGEPIEVNSFFVSHDFMWSRCLNPANQLKSIRFLSPMILCGALIDASCFVGFFLSLFFETMLTKIGESAIHKNPGFVGSPTVRTHGISTASPSGSWPMHIWKSQLWPRKSRCWTAWRRIWSRCRGPGRFFFCSS